MTRHGWKTQPAPLAGSETTTGSLSTAHVLGHNPRPSRGRKLKIALRFTHLAKTQPAPLAGSETLHSRATRRSCATQPAPLAGSETQSIAHICSTPTRHNPRPSRGRKPSKRHGYAGSFWTQPAPLPGSETRLSRPSIQSDDDATPPPPGVETTSPFQYRPASMPKNTPRRTGFFVRRGALFSGGQALCSVPPMPSVVLMPMPA